MRTKKIIVVTGPTATGKTVFTIRLAAHFNSEIISADSRQFYRKMNIGTAKPSMQEQAAVPHHFIDFLNPDEDYNIGRFESDALQLVSELFQKHDSVFVTGGSGLYIKTLCEGIDELPEANESIRTELMREWKENGLQSLQDKLQKEDPEYFQIVDLNNPHRILRALEVIQLSGKPYSSFRTQSKKIRSFDIYKIALLIDRDELYERINKRVDSMMEKGLLEEVRTLLPYRNTNALQTVGYREFFEYFDGKISLSDAINLVKQNTRHYAKRQMTWMRKQEDLHWVEADEIDEVIHRLEEE